jgi:tripartite-type tricarboxylate transporter receptor subunit TctC
MMLIRRHFLQLAVGALALPQMSRTTAGQPGYPARPVRAVVPFPPGGGTDILARLTTQKMSEHFKQQFYVDNIAGAGGNTGTGQAAKAAPDGHTVLFAFGSFVVNPSLFARIPYDARKDFDPVTLAASTPTVLVVNPSVPATTVRELVALINREPGTFSYASGGYGTQPHLVGEQLRLSSDLDYVHVPFNGAGPLNAAVVAGHTQAGFSSLAASAAHIKAGTLRALAVTGKARAQALPDVPTMAEAGFADIVGDSWVGVLVPTGTPKPIVSGLHQAIAEIIMQPDIKERLATLGYEAVASTPAEFAEQINVELEAWGKVVKAANITIQ